MSSTLSYTDFKPANAASTEAHLELCLEGARPLAGTMRFPLVDCDEVVIGRGPIRSQRTIARNGHSILEVTVPDRWMSEVHTRFTRETRVWHVEDAGSRNGTFLNGEQVNRAPLRPGDVLVLGRTLWRFVESGPNLDGIYALAERVPPIAPLSTLNPVLARHFDEAKRVARSTVSVIIEGQTGTGKEVLARAIHEQSGRSGPFVPVNCGAIPQALIESEFFGYTKGAFSGAMEDRVGLVRAADGGTLFLDEVGELSLSAQVALLRVLQEKEVVPLGRTKPIPVDVRIIAATHQSLDDLVARRAFRPDLHARLLGFRVTLPPLAERLEDLGGLIGTLLRRLDPRSAERIVFSPAAARALFSYRWPANVRELEQCLRAALALSGGAGIIEPHHLPADVRASLEAHDKAEGPATASLPPRLQRDDLERRLEELLRLHRGNVSAIARDLQTTRAQIHRWCKRFGRDIQSYR